LSLPVGGDQHFSWNATAKMKRDRTLLHVQTRSRALPKWGAHLVSGNPRREEVKFPTGRELLPFDAISVQAFILQIKNAQSIEIVNWTDSAM